MILEDDIFLAGPIYVLTLLENGEIFNQFVFSRLNIAEEQVKKLMEVYPTMEVDLRTHKMDALTRAQGVFQ